MTDKNPPANAAPPAETTAPAEATAPADAPPPAGALAWATAAAGPTATLRSVRRLAGGTHASTHLLHTAGPPRQLVLRRFPPGDPAAANESTVLTALDGLHGRAPRLVAADPTGDLAGSPATLLTRLPGHADITSIPPAVAATALGEALAAIHATPLSPLSRLRDSFTAAGPAAEAPATGTLSPHLDRLSAQPRVLTHYDYWSGNVLWENDTLTGVVDWSGAGLAPRGFDVSWCRLDLVLLHGPTAAIVFTAAYERAAGAEVPDLRLWDLFALTSSHTSVETWLPNYHDLGRTDLTTTTLRHRHTTWTTRRLADSA